MLCLLNGSHMLLSLLKGQVQSPCFADNGSGHACSEDFRETAAASHDPSFTWGLSENQVLVGHFHRG